MKRKLNCLVLGGGGFIGSHVCDELLKNNYTVTVFDRKGFDKRNLLHIIDKIHIIEGDFSNIMDVKNGLKNVDYIFHLISTTNPSISIDNPLFDIETNLIPTLNLLHELINIKSFKKIIFLSSGGTVYGIPQTIPIAENHQTNPICPYGIVKNTIEHYFLLYQKLFGLKCKIFRLSNPYGIRQNPNGNQGVISIFLKKILSKDSIQIWGDGEIVRDYINIRDVSKILIKSLEIETNNTIYNIGSGVGVSLNSLLSVIKDITKTDIDIEFIQGRSFDVPQNVLDINLIKNDYEWEPKISLEEGINELYNYLKVEI